MIPLADKNNPEKFEAMELFAYPEQSVEGELFFHTFDYTHILTNMHSHILTRGYDYCMKEDFEWIVDNTTGILSQYLVQYKMDTQNAFSAMKMFGKDVYLTLEANERKESAEFVRLVKGWHMACDKRGLCADVRVSGLYEMHKFLTDDMNFWSVPFQQPGRYIHGMTWQTFEALLQMISTHITLYSFAADATYNARSVSTLANESSFSYLVRLDKEGKGYPKASNISKIMGRVVMLNYFKHKRDKPYQLRVMLKPKYPPYLAENDQERLLGETCENYDGYYRDHFFDFADAHKKHRCRRDDITTGLTALRGITGVCQHFKVNESNIPAELHAGNKPKGFESEACNENNS